MAVLVSSEKDLARFMDPQSAPELFEYVRMGGILRLETGKRLKVIYPTPEVIKNRLRELQEKRKEVIHQLSKLRRIKRRGRLLDPLRIKHGMLRIIDAEYRELTDRIEVDRLFNDERGRKIIEQLQKDKEYREKIRQALEESPVYKNRKFGDFVEKSQEIRGKLLDDRVEKFQKMLEEIDKEIDVLRRLLRWT